MSDKRTVKKRLTCILTHKKNGTKETEAVLPFSAGTDEITNAVIFIPFSADTPEAGGKIFLEIGGCTGELTLKADDRTLFSEKDFFAPLRLDVTSLADGGSHTLNAEIKRCGGDIYFGSVAFITVGDSYFNIENRGDCGVTVSSAIGENGTDIIVNADIVNPNNYDVLRCTLISPDGTETVKTGKPTSPVCIFSPETCFLWNGQHVAPLYSVKAELIRDTKLLDSAEIVFGVRKTRFEDGFLLLNGVRLPLNGIRFRNGDFLEDDTELFNKLDANCVHIPVFHGIDEFLSVCDKDGVSVWVDMSAVDTTDENKLKKTVQLLSSHPSLIFASHDSREESEITNFCNCITANANGIFSAGKASFPNEESVTEAIPDVVFVTVPPDTSLESFVELDGSFADYIAAHKNWHIAVFADPPEGFYDRHSRDVKRADCSQEFFSAWHEKFWQTFGIKKGVFGCFAGYLTDEDRTAGRTGLATSDREDAKDAFWFYKSQFSAKKFVKICSAGNTMTDKKFIDIRCYSNGSGIDLTVNGKNNSLPSPEELSNSVYLFRNIKLKRRNNTIVVVSDGGTDSAVIYRSKSKLKKI